MFLIYKDLQINSTVQIGVFNMLKVLKNIVLFLLAPFIALAYIIALPMVGTYMFINLAIELVHKRYAENGSRAFTPQ